MTGAPLAEAPFAQVRMEAKPGGSDRCFGSALPSEAGHIRL